MGRWMMESKKGKFHPMRNEKGRRKRKDQDPNQGVEGHIVDVQDQEAGSGQEVEGGLTAEEGGPTVEGGVHMKGDHLGGDHLPHIIGMGIVGSGQEVEGGLTAEEGGP